MIKNFDVLLDKYARLIVEVGANIQKKNRYKSFVRLKHPILHICWQNTLCTRVKRLL